MTLKEIIGAVRRQIGDVDRQLLTQYVNDVMIDLARDLRPTRTDCIRPYRWQLPRVPVEVIKITRGRTSAAVTYTYVPQLLRYDADIPDLPEWCHAALVTFTVQRYRATRDAA